MHKKAKECVREHCMLIGSASYTYILYGDGLVPVRVYDYKRIYKIKISTF